MTSSPITRSLECHFSKSRIVFWYDEAEQWKGEISDLKLDEVELIRVENNEIGVKFKVLLDAPEQKYLIYVPTARPSDEQNWLLDIFRKSDLNSLSLSSLSQEDRLQKGSYVTYIKEA